MELCVLQHSSLSSVEKLDEIGRQFPDLGYILNTIAIEIIDLQQAAEDDENTIDALRDQIKAERKDSKKMLDDEREAWESVDEAIDEELLKENAAILRELDALKSELWKSDRADLIEQCRYVFSVAVDALELVRTESQKIDHLCRSYKGKFRSEFLSMASGLRTRSHYAKSLFFANGVDFDLIAVKS